MTDFKRDDIVFLHWTSWRDIQRILEAQGQFLQFDDIIQLKRGGTAVEKGAQVSKVKFDGDFLCDENKMMEGHKAVPAGYCILIVPNTIIKKASEKGLEL